MMEVYMEYGAIGIIVSLFVMMIMNLIKSQKLQNEDLDDIRVHISKMESTMENVEGITIKLIERWNKSDDISQRHREDIVKSMNDVTDDLSFLKAFALAVFKTKDLCIICRFKKGFCTICLLNKKSFELSVV